MNIFRFIAKAVLHMMRSSIAAEGFMRIIVKNMTIRTQRHFRGQYSRQSGTDEVITQFYLDKGLESESHCEYRPDVDALNACIAQWSEQGIEFYGMFHTHFGASKTLSLSDQSYIQAIMRAIPEEITQLYFPIILLPEKQIVSYIATRKQEQITIACDEISLVTI